MAVKTLSFEIRAENQIVLDYLMKLPTLKRLLKHIFSDKPDDATDRAVEVFSSADALRSVLQVLI